MSTDEFPEFEDIAVSTKTFIIMTNLTLDIEKLFNYLPITNYVVVPKKRGRKNSKVQVVDPNKDIPDGSIISMEMSKRIRGVDLKKKKKKTEESNGRDFFRNSFTVVMIMGKKINFKISRNGKFQMTGCKTDEQAENCVKQIWDYIKHDKTGIYQLPVIKNSPKKVKHPFRVTFVPAMRNIDFDLKFFLDREKIDDYFNTETEYTSLLELSIGYTGVNIKIPVKHNITELNLKQLVYRNGECIERKTVPYKYYLDTLKPKDRQKKLEKTIYNTFLVFHSGKVIMSSMCAEFARDTYYEFLEIIRRNKENFREQLAL